MTFLLINGDVSSFNLIDNAWDDEDVKPLNVSLFKFAQMVCSCMKLSDGMYAPLIPGFIISDDLQGLVARRELTTFLGVTLGLALYLASLSRAMLCSRKLFLEVGIVDLESVDYERHDFSSLNHRDIAVRPQDPTRSIYADAIIELSLFFCFAHELAHLQRGHIDWLTGRVAPNKTAAQLDPLELQALELDADFTAARWVLIWTLGIIINEDTGVWHIPERNEFGNVEHAFQLLISAVSLFFLGPLNDRETIGSHDVTSTHPDPVHRLEWVAHQIMEDLIQFGGQDPDSTWALAQKACDDVGLGISEVLQLRKTRRSSVAQLRATWKVREKLLVKLDELRSELAPLIMTHWTGSLIKAQ